MVVQLLTAQCVWVQIPFHLNEIERLLPLHRKSVLIPPLREGGQEEGRKPNPVGVRVMQFRGLAASLRSEISRVRV